jgi:UDP-GlcNAc:undecaprenyl-phosphate GlcNAc-1-phosphate transferase
VSNELRYTLAFVVPLVATVALTPVAARVARGFGVMDHPAPHKFHREATPYLGGVAVVAGLLLVGVFTTGASAQLATILVCGLSLFALGLVDDLGTVPPWTKLLVEVGAALALWIVGVRGGPFGTLADLPFTVLWVVAVTNAFNLLDNMDGLLSGVSVFAALAFFAIAAARGDYLVGSFSLAIAGTALGFLRYNFPPARIFMGDAGSLLLGFLLAAIGLKLDLIGPSGITRMAIPALVLGVPLFDMTLVILARIRDRRPVYLGGKDHTSHRLAGSGLSGRGIAVAHYAVQAAFVAEALWMIDASDTEITVAISVTAVIVLGMLIGLLRIPIREPSGAASLGPDEPEPVMETSGAFGRAQSPSSHSRTDAI